MDGVGMQVAKATDCKIAHGNPRKRHLGRGRPIVILKHPLEHLVTIETKLNRKNAVQDEELGNHIQEIQHLCEDIQDDQICPKSETKIDIIRKPD